MKIGIIVYSEKGHTLSVAEKLKQKLFEAGHDTHIERITISGEAAPGKFEVISKPDIADYEGYVFASPVQAFSLNPVMKAYLDSLPQASGKPAAFLTTKQLPFHWTGGNRSIKAMETTCLAKGMNILGSSIVIWKEKESNEAASDNAVTELIKLF